MIKSIIIKCLYKELEETKRKEEKIQELINTNERKIEEENEKRLIRKSIKEEKNNQKNREKPEDRTNTQNTNCITEIIIKSNNGIEVVQEVLKKFVDDNTSILNTDFKGNCNIKIIEIDGQEENSQFLRDCEDK